MAPYSSGIRQEQFGSMDDWDEEEVGIWAALERLPTSDRVRTTIIDKLQGSRKKRNQVDVRDVNLVSYLTNQLFKLNNADEDNENFLSKLRSRIDKAGIELPTLEVRYEKLTVQGKVHVGTRALPTLLNTFLNFFETVSSSLRLSSQKKTQLTILDGVSGILKPGRMTLLLGPPSSGKTTLLLACAGLLEPNLQVQGSILYNGHTLDEFQPRKTSIYISQVDVHASELTVRETMDFSARYQGLGTRHDLITELVRREKELGIHPDPDVDFFMKASAVPDVSHDLVTEYNMKLMGLDNCADTIVGDEMFRGISGGQKKRLTTGEMIVGPARALFMDEITSGLDSSTAFKVVKCIGQSARIMGSTVLMSLLQPAPETYRLFDDILMITGGRVIYHGPLDNVEEFFESCGFKCPPRKSVADYLQEVTSTKDQEQYWADDSRPYQFISVQSFSDSFAKFHVGRGLHEDLEKPYDKSKSHSAALVHDYWSLPAWDLFKITLEREILLIKKSKFIHIFIVGQLMVISVLTSSLYYHSEMETHDKVGAQDFCAALFFIINAVVLIGYSEVVRTTIRLPVFHKFKEMQFFPPWAWALSLLLVKIPFAFLESIVVLGPAYYSIGFAPGVGRFFRLWLLVILAHMMTSGLFRLIAAMCQDMVKASFVGGLAMMTMFTLGGYVLPRTMMKKWWIWAYWVAPISYVENGAVVNEFLAPRWQKPWPGSPYTLGGTFIKNMGSFGRGYWYWLACAAMIGYTILFYSLLAWSLTYVRPGARTRALVFEESPRERHVQSAGDGDRQEVATHKKLSLRRSMSGLASKSQRSPLNGETDSDAQARSAETGSIPSKSLSRPYSTLSSPRSGSDIEVGMILPFQPLAISFSDVSYFVDMPAEMKQHGHAGDKLQLLRRISGAFRPGVLTALVGVTGAGKSTLMDVLSGRKTKGYMEGDIRISGFPKKQETFARIAGYCEQNDIHSPHLTVHESIIFSGWLRLAPEIEPQMKLDFALEVMDLVELTSLKDALVGVPGQSGLSTEQRKRLTISIELVANPSIIFMDEPTSGLDARAAAIVMRSVRNTVDTGRTVVCTIHQPSIDIFESFDELLLLKLGGQTVYAGPLGKDSHKLVEYFQNIEGIPKIKDGENPAAWMLDVSSPGMEQRLKVDFAEIYRKSSVYGEVRALVEELSSPAHDAQDLSFPGKYAQPMWSQFTTCLWKSHWSYWRDPAYNVSRIFLALVTALFFGTNFWGLAKNISHEQTFFAVLGAMFCSQAFYGILTCASAQPGVASERIVFYRERSAGMYSEIPYAAARCLIEVPYVLFTATLFSMITFSMLQLEWTALKLFWYIYFTFASQMTWIFWAFMSVSITPNIAVASIMSGFLFNGWLLFSGFTRPHPRFPSWWRWVFWADPVQYNLSGLMVSQFGDVKDTYVTTQLGGRIALTDLMGRTYGYKHSFLALDAAIGMLWPVAFAIMFIIAMKYINYQTR